MLDTVEKIQVVPAYAGVILSDESSYADDLCGSRIRGGDPKA